MKTGTIEEAGDLLKALPLGEAGIVSFELIPIGPLRPISALLEVATHSGNRSAPGLMKREREGPELLSGT